MLEVHIDGQDKPVIFQKLPTSDRLSNDEEKNEITAKDKGKEDKKVHLQKTFYISSSIQINL